MKPKIGFVLSVSLLASPLTVGQAQAQGAAAPSASCVPPAQPALQSDGRRGAGTPGQVQPLIQPTQPGRGEAPQRGSRDATVTPIPGVVAAGAAWTKVWQAGGNSADGILADKDGNALVAQEDYDAVLKIDRNDKASVYVSNEKGVGSLSMDRQGRHYGAHRTERPGSTKPDRE